MAPNLLRRASQAVALNAVANWVTMLSTFLSIIVIARILTPYDYGVYAIALMVVSLPEILASGTLSDVLIQRRDLRSGHINSVFLQSVLIAIVSWLAIILLAPLIASAFNDPSVAPVLIVAGVILPIGAVMSVPASLLQRDLRYKEITAVDIFGTLAAAIVGIALALMWRNVWALVGMELSRRFIRLAAFLYFAKWRPQATSNWTDFSDLASFNLANAASKILMRIESMLPKSLIGITLGSYAVGVFNLPERLYAQASSALIAPFGAVSMPVASAMQDNRESLHRAMDSSIRMAALLAYPTFIGALIIAPVAIPTLFGEQWLQSVPIFQIYMLIGLRAPMTSIMFGVFRGVGRPDVPVWIMVVSIISTFVLLVGTYRFGLVAIALALLAKHMITFVFSTWLIQHVIGFSVWRQLKAGSSALFASLIMAAFVWAFMSVVPDGAHGLLSVLTAVLIGGLVYPVALYFFMPRLGRQALLAIRLLLSGQPRKALQTVRRELAERESAVSGTRLEPASPGP